MAKKHGRTKETIRKHLDDYRVIKTNGRTAESIVLCMDCTFFGRGYGILVACSPNLRQNLYWEEVTAENKAAYEEARRYLEREGFIIQAVVLDIKTGIREVFADLVVQACQFHEQQIVQRYLTNKPKTTAGRELKLISDLLTRQSEESFRRLLAEWHERWQEFLKERSYVEDRSHWWYTHRRLRSAYRSLRTNMPYLYSYQKHPELNIPNTNNSLEGYFSRIKQLLNNHHGLRKWRRYRMIEEVLNG